MSIILIPNRHMTDVCALRDWDEIRNGVIVPPLLARGCQPRRKSPIALESPAVLPQPEPMKRLQRSGMLTFEDFGADWVAPPQAPERSSDGILPVTVASDFQVPRSPSTVSPGIVNIVDWASRWTPLATPIR